VSPNAGPVERDDLPALGDVGKDVAPRERRCAEPVQEDDGGLTLAGLHEVVLDPPDLDESGVRARQVRGLDRTRYLGHRPDQRNEHHHCE
jgi:hypothetical protein